MAPNSRVYSCTHRDDRRSRELYRYFQPSNPAALPYTTIVPHGEEGTLVSSTDTTATVEGATAVLASIPKTPSGPSSPNATLTSFAQLAAVQLNTQRALIWSAL